MYTDEQVGRSQTPSHAGTTSREGALLCDAWITLNYKEVHFKVCAVIRV